MEIRHLRYFSAVTEDVIVTNYAQKLRPAQPSLMQPLQNIEDEIGGSPTQFDSH